MERKPRDFRKRRVLVVGLGLHGGAVSAIQWLVKAGAHVRVTDLKTETQLASSVRRLRRLPITLHLGGHRPADFAWAEIIYQNQGVPPTLPELRQARREKKPIVNEVTIFFERCPAKIIGVTGTRGKSTTSSLIAAILQRHNQATYLSGNIRQTPMLTLLAKLKPNDTVVLELSSFQLEFLPIIQRSPAVGVMTNLKIDHLNRYPSLAAYARAKHQLFRWQTTNGVAVLNADVPLVRAAAKITRAKVFWFSRKPKPSAVTIQNTMVGVATRQRFEPIVSLRTWKLAGKHQQENLLAAVATVRALGVPPKTIQAAIRNFTSLAHRQELIRRWHGHPIINDTTATTPDGTLAALEVFPKAVLILGGTDKALDYRALVQRLKSRPEPIVFLPGSATEILLQQLRRTRWRARHVVVDSMLAAVRHAAKFVKPGQAIVLSPGAASFGLFQHEFDRGEQFIRAVHRLP